MIVYIAEDFYFAYNILMNISARSAKKAQLFLKRLIDIVASLLFLILAWPLLLFIFLLIKLTSPGPAIFKQTRTGLREREFTMFKFRSMINDAEQLKEELLRLNIMKGPVFKIKDDPRITRVGKILRRTSLDELPQFWNVLLGDMSLVGPRPPIITEVREYKGWQMRRLDMRPGITCLWQISGRSKIIDFIKWTRLDLEYIDNWTLGLDFKILLKTMPVVFSGLGAE